MQKYISSHRQALVHPLNYVNSTYGHFKKLNQTQKISVQAYIYSDWGTCVDTRQTAHHRIYIMMLGNSQISQKSKKQHVVSRSSSEAEYHAMASAACEVTWLVKLLQEYIFTKRVTLFVTIKWPFLLKKILYYMNERNIWC